MRSRWMIFLMALTLGACASRENVKKEYNSQEDQFTYFDGPASRFR